MRIKHKVNVRIADDANMKDMLFGPDDELAEIVADGFLRQASGIIALDAAATESLSFGDVDAVKGLYLKIDQDVQVDINGLGNLQMRRHTTTTGTYAKLFIEGDITSVSITNGGSAARGLWCVWGDPAT